MSTQHIWDLFANDLRKNSIDVRGFDVSDSNGVFSISERERLYIICALICAGFGYFIYRVGQDGISMREERGHSISKILEIA